MKIVIIFSILFFLNGCKEDKNPHSIETHRDRHIETVTLDGDTFYYYRRRVVDDYASLMKIIKSDGTVIYPATQTKK